MRYLLVLLLAGCAQEGGWNKYGASQQDFYEARGDCVSRAFVAPTPYQQNMIIIGCMQSKGWFWETK